MALFDLHRPRFGRTVVGQWADDMIGAIIAWNDERVTRDALSKLSDHELEDVGLTRSDIPHVNLR